MHLTTADIELLSKGLSFTPTPMHNIPKDYLNLLQQYDQYARTIRSQYSKTQLRQNLAPHNITPPLNSDTAQVFRKMKFLKNKPIKQTHPLDSCQNSLVEKYIHSTKIIINDNLPKLYYFPKHQSNLSKQQRKAIKKLVKNRQHITIKPADKNLGIVVLDTDDYLKQCIMHLTNQTIYRVTNIYPEMEITQLITNILIPYKQLITRCHKKLYQYLQPQKKHRVPQFYGIPKIHKQYTTIPPIRPIISHSNSLLSHTAQFIDHVLQPLSKSYPDYLQNSTSLIQTLENLTVSENITLVTIDVVNLYPSIPQTECLEIIYNEMYTHSDLILFDPNLVIKLLHININYNYFEFIKIYFQQIQGTAMGAAFSPSLANIFMSVILRRFLNTQKHQPILLRRYIDDIFMIWSNEHNLTEFMNNLNTFHPNLKFTNHQSNTSTDFLDLTIYKGYRFSNNNILDIKTFQKPQNLYQYLHYNSHHVKSIHKGLIIGECIRYIRSNTCEEQYHIQIQLFKNRLLKRGYPTDIINKYTQSFPYSKRLYLLRQQQPRHKSKETPIFKCLPPPQYQHLKHIILQKFHYIKKYVNKPLMITLGYPTLKKILVRAHYKPTNEQLLDALLMFPEQPDQQHISAGKLPQIKNIETKIQKCQSPKCVTCTHLNTTPYFTSTTTKTTYLIRHSFSCNSTNLIYLITCTKCRKQYVGLTTKTLRERINHHRTSIHTKQKRYINNHFNFPDHSIKNLSVQPIDTIHHSTPQTLVELERYWIHTLNTLKPYGLNNTQ